MKGEISLNTLCDRLKLNIPAVLEMAIDGKLPLWIRLNDVDILTEKNNRPIFRQQVAVRPDSEVLSDLSLMVQGESNRKEDIDKILDNAFKKAKNIYALPAEWPYMETFPLMAGPPPSGEFEPVPKKEVLLYTAMLAYNEKGERIAVTTRKQTIELELRPSDLFAYLSDVERFKKEGCIENPCIAPTKKPTNKGGRRPEPFSEAIDHLYKQLFDTGKYESLKEGNIESFIDCLKGSIKADDFISSRIEKIAKPSGSYKITTTDFVKLSTDKREETIKSQVFFQNDVAVRLVRLRKKYPLP